MILQIVLLNFKGNYSELFALNFDVKFKVEPTERIEKSIQEKRKQRKYKRRRQQQKKKKRIHTLNGLHSVHCANPTISFPFHRLTVCVCIFFPWRSNYYCAEWLSVFFCSVRFCSVMVLSPFRLDFIIIFINLRN